MVDGAESLSWPSVSLAKKPRLRGCCFPSSRPTSSKLSSGVGGWRSILRWTERCWRGKRAESRLWRTGASLYLMGDFAAMSCDHVSLSLRHLAHRRLGRGRDWYIQKSAYTSQKIRGKWKSAQCRQNCCGCLSTHVKTGASWASADPFPRLVMAAAWLVSVSCRRMGRQDDPGTRPVSGHVRVGRCRCH